MTNRKRVILGILGVMCCSSLVLTSLGLFSCVADITGKQFDKDGIFRYDVQITVDGKNDELLKAINSDERIDKAVYISKNAVSVSNNDVIENSVSIVVPLDGNKFNNFIDIGKENLTDNDVIITRGVSEKLNIKSGDTISVTDSNYEKIDLKVTAVSDNYINDYIYLSKSSYAKIFDNEPDFTYILCNVKDNVKNDDIKAFADGYSKNEFVTSSSTALSLEKAEKISVDRIGKLLALFIGCAILFSIILIYMISDFSFSQKIREIANIKALGFSDRDALIYVMREVKIFSVAGCILGIVLGTVVYKSFISVLQIDNIVYNDYIQWWSYIVTAGVISVTVLISSVPVIIKIRKLNMAETLKETV